MIKKDLVNKVSEETFCSQITVSRIIDSVLNNITLALAKGEEVQLTGFGTFKPRRRNARIGRNPHTKEAVPIPARIIPSFKPGKDLNAKVCRDIKE